MDLDPFQSFNANSAYGLNPSCYNANAANTLRIRSIRIIL